MNVTSDHPVHSRVVELATTGIFGQVKSNRSQRRQPHRVVGAAVRLLVLVGLGAALALPAQEVTVVPPQGRSADTDNRAATTDGTRAARGAADASRATAPTTTVVNPLDGYLADWMRPRDRTVTRTGKAPAPAAADSWRSLPTISPAIRKPAPKAVSPNANPYIEAMNAAPGSGSVTPSPASPIVTGTPAPGSLTAPASLAEPEAPAPPPATRYQPPPSSDKKYFPQLKRF